MHDISAQVLRKLPTVQNLCENRRISFQDLIAPMSEEVFFAEIWEKKVVLFDRSDASFLKQVFTLDDVDQILSSYQLKASECRIVKHEEKIQPHEYTLHRGVNRGVMREDFVDKDKMFSFYRKGATIILEGAQFFSSKLSSYCRSLEQDIGCRMHANIYVTPERAQGFPIHFDTHDLIIFQIHGSKRWNFYESPIALPLKEQYSSCVPVTPKTAEITMEQGDVLYLPRGVQHEALTQDDASIHIALGIYPTLWSDLLGDLVKWASLNDEVFRKVGPRFLASSADRSCSIGHGLRLLEILKEKIVSDDFSKHLQQQAVSDHRNISGGYLSAIEESKHVRSDSHLMVRKDVIYSHRIENASYLLSFHKTAVRMNESAYAIVSEMIRRKTFRPADLAHFHGEEIATSLCVRLMNEGFLQLSHI